MTVERLLTTRWADGFVFLFVAVMLFSALETAPIPAPKITGMLFPVAEVCEGCASVRFSPTPE